MLNENMHVTAGIWKPSCGKHDDENLDSYPPAAPAFTWVLGLVRPEKCEVHTLPWQVYLEPGTELLQAATH